METKNSQKITAFLKQFDSAEFNTIKISALIEDYANITGCNILDVIAYLRGNTPEIKLPKTSNAGLGAELISCNYIQNKVRFFYFDIAELRVADSFLNLNGKKFEHFWDIPEEAFNSGNNLIKVFFKHEDSCTIEEWLDL